MLVREIKRRVRRRRKRRIPLLQPEPVPSSSPEPDPAPAPEPPSGGSMKKLGKLTKAEIKGELEKRGISFDGRWAKARLLALLVSSMITRSSSHGNGS